MAIGFPVVDMDLKQMILHTLNKNAAAQRTNQLFLKREINKTLLRVFPYFKGIGAPLESN